MKLRPLHVAINIYTKVALAAYVTECTSISVLTTHQLELVRKIIAVLEPVEEITKLISTDEGQVFSKPTTKLFVKSV